MKKNLILIIALSFAAMNVNAQDSYSAPSFKLSPMNTGAGNVEKSSTTDGIKLDYSNSDQSEGRSPDSEEKYNNFELNRWKFDELGEAIPKD